MMMISPVCFAIVVKLSPLSLSPSTLGQSGRFDCFCPVWGRLGASLPKVYRIRKALKFPAQVGFDAN
jgi:hypothetical protein